MDTILALTVGGSCAPIVTAVRDYHPVFVCFIATRGSQGSRLTVDGPGRPCRGDPDDAPSIVAQLELPSDRYQVVELDDPDALPEIYGVCRRTLRALAEQFPGARYIADYTGGSKSMGVGLVLAALECGWELSLVRGQRPDLIKVANGTEMAGLVNSWEVRASQQMEEARYLFNVYAYASAGELLTGLLRQAPLSPELDRTIRRQVALCRGFDAWDRFDHANAVSILSTVQSHIVPQWRFLKALTGRSPATGYELVLDLLRNAERRAARGRYDDAVARLYRALELLAQTRLLQREPALQSGDLNPALLPETLQAKYEALREPGEKGKVRLGLRQDYELLTELGDPLGQIYQKYADRLLHALSYRNESILAHGQTPITRDVWQKMYDLVTEFIQAGLETLQVRLEAPQFPQWEEQVL